MIVFKALLLGIVEGVTEFLPISSTGHLILAAQFLDFPEHMRGTFEVFIQLGAILAVVWHFRLQLSETILGAARDRASRDLLAKVLLAFLPSALVGATFGGAIQAYLFSPRLVGVTLLLGGVAILAIERFVWRLDTVRAEDTPWRSALLIGLAQLLSMVPGVSRAAATIIGGLMAGLSRPVATVFSFYLSIPTMVAASSYSLFKVRHELTFDDVAPLTIGFAAAFLSASIVVRAFLGYVQRHDFTAFGIYRVIVGILVLAVV